MSKPGLANTGIMIAIAPFNWRPDIDYDPDAGSLIVYLGPIVIGFGWPRCLRMGPRR